MGFKSLNEVAENLDMDGPAGDGPLAIGEVTGSGGESIAEDETMAMRCFDGGGTLSIVGMFGLWLPYEGR